MAFEHIKAKEKIHVVVFQHGKSTREEGVSPHLEGMHVDAAQDFAGADS